jgi:hypothetical protein
MNINDSLQNLAQLLQTRTGNTSLVEAERQSPASIQLVPGQQIQAEVLAALPNHRFLVRIAAELYKMELPIIVKPGEMLPMTFVGEQPRITFAVSKDAGGASQVQISDTGKWLNRLATNQSPPAPVARGTTITQSPPTDTLLLASQLRDALTLKGTFYESSGSARQRKF